MKVQQSKVDSEYYRLSGEKLRPSRLHAALAAKGSSMVQH